MYVEPDATNETSLLTIQEIERIQDSTLSNTDKHYLRLLAHCLASFKKMGDQSQTVGFPSETIRTEWLRNQNSSLIDEKFLNAFLTQLVVAEETLRKIANTFEISPMELTLDHLIDFLENH